MVDVVISAPPLMSAWRSPVLVRACSIFSTASTSSAGETAMQMPLSNVRLRAAHTDSVSRFRLRPPMTETWTRRAYCDGRGGSVAAYNPFLEQSFNLGLCVAMLRQHVA